MGGGALPLPMPTQPATLTATRVATKAMSTFFIGVPLSSRHAMHTSCLAAPLVARCPQRFTASVDSEAPGIPLPPASPPAPATIDLETGATRMIEATTIDALSSIALLIAITLLYPTKRLIHVFLDNARYHHAVLVQEWLAKPGCRIKVHYIPSYCPHLDPIERLWGLMHRHVTHNRSHPSYNDFCRSVLHFLRVEVPKNRAVFCDSVTDNFRVINPADFRVLKA